MKKKKPIVLISNDDGIESDGIKALWKEIKKFAEVHVVAPHTQQSAVGHSITISSPIRARKNLIDRDFYGYAVEGTPADSVKLAVRNLLKGKKIDLLISGINHGSNASINIIYSGTLSAAMEASLEGIFSFGFSSTSFRTFISRWWPLLFIASGLVLLIAWGIQRLLPRPEGRRGREPGGGSS